MSYRLTEAERKHIATIEDSKIWISGNYENTIPAYDIYISDNDKMNGLTDSNFHIRLPKYKFQWDDAFARLHLVDVAHNDLEIYTDGPTHLGIGWRYTLSTEKISGTEYVTALKFMRDNDNSGYVLDLSKLGDTTIKSLKVDGTTYLSGVLTVEDDANFNSDITVSGITTLRDFLQAENADFNSDVRIDGTLDVFKKSSFYSGVLIQEGLTSYGETRLHGDTYVTSDGNLTVAGKVTGKKDASFAGRVSAKEFNALSGITAGTDITAGNNITAKNDLTVENNAYISGNLNVSGLTTLTKINASSGNFEDVNTDYLTVNKHAVLSGLDVSGDVHISGNIDIIQTLDISGKITGVGGLSISGVTDITTTNNFNIYGDTVFHDDVYIKDNTTISGNSVINGTLTVRTSISSPSGKITSISGDDLSYNNAYISELIFDKISGGISGGEIISKDITAQYISGDYISGIESNFEDITANDISTDFLNVTTDTSLNGIIDASGIITLEGTTTIKGDNTLYVDTNSYFSKDARFIENVLVDKNTNISGTLEVKGITTLKDHTYIGSSGIIGGSPIIFTSHTETLDLNDALLLLYGQIMGANLIDFEVTTQRAIDISTNPPTEYIDDQAWPVIKITKDGSLFTGETKNPGLAVIKGVRDDGKRGQILVQVGEDGSWLYDGGSSYFYAGHYLDTSLADLSLADPLEDPNGNPLVFGMPIITGGNTLTIGSKNLYVHGDIYAKQKVDTFQINDANTENQLIIYTSGLTPADLAHPHMYNYNDPDRIKAIINGEVQYLATIEDVWGTSLSGAVTLHTDQTITGTKYFSGVVYTDQVYTYTPDGPGTGIEQRLISREIFTGNQPYTLVGNFKDPTIIYSASDEHFSDPSIKDNHLKVIFDDLLGANSEKFLANTDDIVIPAFTDPTNGQVLGDASLTVVDNSGIFTFTTLDATQTYSGWVENVPITSGEFKFAIQTDEYLKIESTGANTIKLSNIHISGIEERLNVAEDDIDSLSGEIYNELYKKQFIGNSGIKVQGINGINPKLEDAPIRIGIEKIDFVIPNDSLPQQERFPTTYAVVSGIAEETQRATFEENKLKNRLPEAPDNPGYYSMTAHTLNANTKLYAWTASQMPPTPINGDGGGPYQNGDEFALKFIITNAATGEGNLIWEKII